MGHPRPLLQLLGVLVLCAAVCGQQNPSPPPSPPRRIFPGLLARSAAQGQAMSLQQLTTSTASFGSKPRCMAVYFDAPSWSKYQLKVSVDSLNQQSMNSSCLQRAIRWRSAVVGADVIPRPLSTAVGISLPFSNSNYTETARTGELLRDDDYNSTPEPQPMMDGEVGRAILRGAADCLRDAAATAFTGQVPDLKDCLAGISIPGDPRPPPPPPPPSPPSGTFREAVASFRDQLGLSPFFRDPIHISSRNPNDKLTGTVTTSMADYNSYELAWTDCENGFKQNNFQPWTLDTPSKQLDSCFFSQTVVYLTYDGSCPNTNVLNPFTDNVVVNVSMTYSDYNGCDDNPLVTLGETLEIVAWVCSIPVAIFIIYLTYPTMFRIAYRMLLNIYIFFLPRSKSDTKRKHKLRMEIDAYLHWGWVTSISSWACIRWFLDTRKRVVYTTLTIKNPNGRTRVLMMSMVAAAAVSVTAQVWRPQTQLVLKSNPTRITLQLEDVNEPYRALARYFQISAISLYLGCLVYLASLTNTNEPVEDDFLEPENKKGKPGTWSAWRVQKVIAITATIMLIIFLLLQAVNITFFIPIISDANAFIWVVSVQYFNMLLIILAQIYDIVMVQRNVRLRLRPGSKPKPYTLQSFFEGICCWCEGTAERALTIISGDDRTGRVKSADPDHLELGTAASRIAPRGASSITELVKRGEKVPADAGAVDSTTVLGSPLMGLYKPPSHHDDGSPDKHKKKTKHRSPKIDIKPAKKNELLHWWRGDRDENVREELTKEEKEIRKRQQEQEVQMTIWQQIATIFQEALGEDPIIITLPDGNTIKSRSFRYPTWFLSSLMTAFYVLVFQFAFSLTFAERAANCVVSWSECEILWIRDFIGAFSFGQLAVVRATASKVSMQLSSLQDVGILINALLADRGINVSLESLIGIANDVQDLATPGGGPRSAWLLEYSKRVKLVTTLGFTLGMILAMYTLVQAAHSFKAVCKKHRLLLLSRRILGGGQASASVQDASMMMMAINHLGDRNAGETLSTLDTMMHTTSFHRTKTRRGGSTQYSNTTSPVAARHFNALSSSGPSGTHPDHPTPLPLSKPQAAHTTVLVQTPAIPEEEDATVLVLTSTPTTNIPNQLQTADPATSPSLSTWHDAQTPSNNSPSLPLPPSAPNAPPHVATLDRGPWPLDRATSSSPSESSDEEYEGDEADAEDLKPLKEPEVFGVATLAAFRAQNAAMADVVFLLGSLLSCTIVQLYTIGIIFSVILSFVMHPFFWNTVVKTYWPFAVAAVVVVIINQFMVVGVIGGQYVSDCKKIKRPAGWAAFLIVMSITQLVLGLLIAVIRLAWLVMTSVLTVGYLDRTILSIGHQFDVPHNAFLASVYLQGGAGMADSEAQTPGPRWRAIKRWRGAAKFVGRLGPKRFAALEARNLAREQKAGKGKTAVGAAAVGRNAEEGARV